MEVDQGTAPSSVSAPSAARAKGRQALQLRTLVCELSTLNRADGSARFSQGESVVLAAVHGPRQANARREDAEKAVVEVVFKPMVVVGRAIGAAAASSQASLQAAESRVFERIIKGTVEAVVPLGLLPRTSIMVVLQVVNGDGSLLACALNAACAALVDAGVPMLSLFAAVTCACGPAGKLLLLDPDQAEEQAAGAVITLAFPHHSDFTDAAAEAPAAAAAAAAASGPAGGTDGASPPVSRLVVEEGLLTSQTTGVFTSDQYFDAFDACREGCRCIAEFGQLSLKKTFQAA